jgi:hypothetical protein
MRRTSARAIATMAMIASQLAEVDLLRCLVNLKGPRSSYREFSAANANPGERIPSP